MSFSKAAGKTAYTKGSPTLVSYPLGKNYPGKTKGMSGKRGAGTPAYKAD